MRDVGLGYHVGTETSSAPGWAEPHGLWSKQTRGWGRARVRARGEGADCRRASGADGSLWEGRLVTLLLGAQVAEGKEGPLPLCGSRRPCACGGQVGTSLCSCREL